MIPASKYRLPALVLCLCMFAAGAALAATPPAKAGASAATAAAKSAKPAKAAKVEDPNAVCLDCHDDKDLKSEKGASVNVDPTLYAHSVHGDGNANCIECHVGLDPDEVPHRAKPVPVQCGDCHEKEVKEYAGTIHGKARAGGDGLAATCVDCHGKHDMLSPKDPKSKVNHVNLEATCGACHGDDALIAKAKLKGGNVASQYHDSIHGKLLAGKGATQAAAPTCTDCHGAHNIKSKQDPTSRTARANVPATCGSCHQQVKSIYDKSEHGKLKHDGSDDAPGCTDCHSAHRIQRHDAPQWKLDVIAECGNCHADFVETYRDTFHGQVTALGFARMATCASCHGSHEILPASNPASKVSAQNRLATCRVCHPTANANFAAFDPHANKHDKARSLSYYIAGLFMKWLLIGVFAFFGLHTILWFYRSLQVRLASRKNPADAEEGK
jgi:hypothetical protein